MILIEENELIHVDSCDDVIEHFGTKGMKWGVRKAGAYAKSYGRAIVNKYRHPILYGIKAMRKHMSATKDRAVLAEMYEKASKSRGRAMTMNTNKANRLALVANAKDKKSEKLRRKASGYMN